MRCFEKSLLPFICTLLVLLAAGCDRSTLPSLTAMPEGTIYLSAPGQNLQVELARHHYQLREFLLAGTHAGKPYQARLVLIAPQEAADFSGVLVTELSHSGVWQLTREYLLRSGHAWALIGTPGDDALSMLQHAGRGRYDALWLPPDPINAPILHQALALLQHRSGANPLPAPAQTLLLTAYGADADRVRNWLRATPDLGALDAVLLAGPALREAPQPLPDLPLPVLDIFNENEVLRAVRAPLGRMPPSHRRPDAAKYRLYELAGAPHLDTSERALEDPAFAHCVEQPLSRLPMRQTYAALMALLVNWAQGHAAPPQAERLQLQPNGQPYLDETGNVVGGVRHPLLNVPFARFSALNQNAEDAHAGALDCTLVGYQQAFDAIRLYELYGTQEIFRAQLALELGALQAAGWLLAEDAAELTAQAASFSW